MKVLSLIMTSILISAFVPGPAKSPKEVLFIGNSLTYYHDMPTTLQEMLNEKGAGINIHQITLPGVSLSDHLLQAKTLNKLNSQNWDIVILQEGTVKVLVPEVRKYAFEPAILKFDSLIKMKGGQTILYQAYAISIYPETYCYPSTLISKEISKKQCCSKTLTNSAQEFKIIRTSFKHISKQIACDVAEVGFCFELCKKKYPELSLFEGKTDSHPSILGSYLIACVFFRQLTGEKTATVKYALTVKESDKSKINDIVDSL